MKKKEPWPTKAVMEQIYSKNLWGNNASEFFSGEGSHQPEIVNPYVEAVISFFQTFKKPLVVCDLGCGDFNVGKKLVQYTKTYIAVDIVSSLITYNKTKFKAKNLEFQCLDIAVDDLPVGDCALIRQVLQHLSNAEIQNVLNKLKDFKYIILTEHIPKGDFIANVDIISGQGTRLKKQSGLHVLAPPFNLKVVDEQQLSSISLNEDKGVIVTTLYKIS
jgi:SAM-dependent methyltransferase